MGKIGTYEYTILIATIRSVQIVVISTIVSLMVVDYTLNSYHAALFVPNAQLLAKDMLRRLVINGV